MAIKYKFLEFQDGGRPLLTIKNHHISAMAWPIVTKFGTLTWTDLLNSNSCYVQATYFRSVISKYPNTWGRRSGHHGRK